MGFGFLVVAVSGFWVLGGYREWVLRRGMREGVVVLRLERRK